MSDMAELRKITLKNIIGYASVNFLGGGAQLLISAWLMYFYTTMCNLNALEASGIFTAARIIDALGNPIMGFITDNFLHTRLGRKFGRRRFFILLGVPTITIVFPLLWITGQSLTYYFIMNLIYEVCFTMVIVPCSTLPAEMTQNAAEKSKLTGAKQFCGIVASTIAAFVPGRLFVVFGKNSPDAFLYTGLVYGVMLGISLLIVYLFTFERDPEDVHYDSQIKSFWSIFPAILSDVSSSMHLRTFRLHCVLMCVGGIFKNLTTGVFTYFVIFVLMLDPIVTSNISGITTMTSSGALMLFIICCYKWGGPAAYKISTIVVFLSLGGYFYLTHSGGGSSITVLLTLLAVANMAGRAGIDYVPVFQLPFMADIDEAVTGQRREGLFTGVNSLLSKVATAVEAALLGAGLEAFGFVKGVPVQTDSAILGIEILTIAAPFVLLTITWLACNRLKLTKETHKIVVDEVHRLRSGGSMEDATDEVKKVFKLLTGYDYQDCWGRKHGVGGQEVSAEHMAH